MHFITCFDENYLENSRRFQGGNDVPRDAQGRVEYLRASHRTFGYFADHARAVEAVLRNEMDLHECLYTWCVVETLGEGIHPFGDLDHPGSNETWFRWDLVQGRWEPVSRPACFDHILGGFALG